MARSLRRKFSCHVELALEIGPADNVDGLAR